MKSAFGNNGCRVLQREGGTDLQQKPKEGRLGNLFKFVGRLESSSQTFLQQF